MRLHKKDTTDAMRSIDNAELKRYTLYYVYKNKLFANISLLLL